MDHTDARVSIDGVSLMQLLGPNDRLLTSIEQYFPGVRVHVYENEISVRGERHHVDIVRRIIEDLLAVVRNGEEWAVADIAASARFENTDVQNSGFLGQAIVTARGRSVRPQTPGQKEYVNAIDNNTIVFGIGPAGTGKTYLAVAKAVQALHRKEVERIVLTRPAVEAGERLGFLPGTLTDKVDPYLRPLFDALHEMMDPEIVPKMLTMGTVEIAPLAYMRGRTLNDSFIILDEAQNTTPQQMKMFLTRLGFGSKMVVTGDITQVDVPVHDSGLQRVPLVLRNLDDIHFSWLTSQDVVRHTLVSRIVDAYTTYEAHNETSAKRHNS